MYHDRDQENCQFIPIYKTVIYLLIVELLNFFSISNSVRLHSFYALNLRRKTSSHHFHLQFIKNDIYDIFIAHKYTDTLQNGLILYPINNVSSDKFCISYFHKFYL